MGAPRAGARSVITTVAVACALGAGGCGERAAPAPDARVDLSRVVLSPADVPGGFRQVERAPQFRSEQPEGRSDPRRFGRRDGWKARFARPGDGRTEGPLVIEARLDEFADRAGAQRDLDRHREDQRAALPASSGRFLLDPGIGDASFAYAVRQPGVNPVRHFTVAWRSGRYTGTVTVNGFRALGLRDAVELARRQDARMRRPPRR